MMNPQDNKPDNKEIYLFILIPSEEKINFQKIKYESEIIPKIFLSENILKEDGSYLVEIIFKFVINKEKDKEEEQYTIKFNEEGNKYILSFDIKNKSFIYSPKLKRIKNNYIIEEPIEQNIIPLYNKFNIFLEALKENNERDIEEKLLEDTIDIYKTEKKFSLLITLFLKIYLKYKDLCNKLIEIYYNINEEENNDREKYIKKDLITFHDIYSKAEDIIKENKYNPIYFFGILFCYFNYYDNKDNFNTMINKFCEKNSDTLYEILIKYYTHFMNPLNQNKDFYNSFIKYILEKNKDINIFKRTLDYIEDIETFLFVINDNKEKIFKNYDKLNSSPIKIGAYLKLIKYSYLNDIQVEENECDNIIKYIENIIKFSEKEKILAIYLKSTFWMSLIQNYDISNLDYIDNIYKLRELFKKYNKLINDLFDEDINEDSKVKKIKKKKKDEIKFDINNCYERDEFAILLNKNLKDFFIKNKDKNTNGEILSLLEKYNPYFSFKNLDDKKRYKNKREIYIFDYINFSETTPIFIKYFRNFNFEIMFENNINDYINILTGKIKDIQTFDNVTKLVNINRLKKEIQKNYIEILKEKYKLIVMDIKLIKEKDELYEVSKIIARFVSKVFLFEKNNNFLDDKIEKLDNEIKNLIYIELINKYNNEEYKEQNEHIYDIYLNKIEAEEGRYNVLKFMEKLSGEDKKYFIYEKLLKKCEFTKEEFFSSEENYKIKTLCFLKYELENYKLKENDFIYNEKYEKDLDLNYQAEQGNKAASYIINLLDEIRRDLDNGNILKKDLEKFLKIKEIKKIKDKKSKDKYDVKDEFIKIRDEEEEKEKEKQEVIEKLGLISLILSNYDPYRKYYDYKKIIEKIKRLIFIKDSLMIYHKNIYIEDIQGISNLINEIENSPIINFRNEEMYIKIEKIQRYEVLCDEINKLKDFLLFNKIYENAQGKERFEDAGNKLYSLKRIFDRNNSNIDIEIIFEDKDFQNIFQNIKEESSKKDESESRLFINQMRDYFNIRNESIIKDLIILIRSNKYEIIIKSIKYFFDTFTNEKLKLPSDLNLSQMKLKELKKTLQELKQDVIFDYESNNHYYKVFTSFYEKSEAIEFLKRYINKDKKDLSNKLKNNLEIISIKDIDDTIECLTHFKNFKNKNSSEIIKYIKLLSEKEIAPFENYSKKFSYIIKLDE